MSQQERGDSNPGLSDPKPADGMVRFPDKGLLPNGKPTENSPIPGDSAGLVIAEK